VVGPAEDKLPPLFEFFRDSSLSSLEAIRGAAPVFTTVLTEDAPAPLTSFRVLYLNMAEGTSANGLVVVEELEILLETMA
jgi:hypothetical protein